MIDPNEAPQGLRAVKYLMATNCDVGCALSNRDKKCKKTNCSSSTRADRTEVYFKEE